MPQFKAITDQGVLARLGKLTPAYVTALDIENFRCFRRPQTLKLTREDGQPARWTIILGDNNTGKTTLLQCIASSFPITTGAQEVDEGGNPTDKNVELNHGSRLHQGEPSTFGSTDSNFCMTAHFHIGDIGTDSHRSLAIKTERLPVVGSLDKFIEQRLSSNNSMLTISGGPKTGKMLLQEFSSHNDFQHSYFSLFVAYGANRIGLPSVTPHLSDDAFGGATSSLFSIDARLRNAEEWLLQIDYASRLAPYRGHGQSSRVSSVRSALIKMLPQVIRS
jgi:AAA domain